MKTTRIISFAAVLAALLPLGGVAQVLQAPIQYFRPYDQRGINTFETTKDDTVAYLGFNLRVGASFTQGYQNIIQENYAGNVGLTPTVTNQLIEIAGGFPLATANLNLDAQIAEGIRVHLVSYMSSHHHNDFWVKGGYLQVDRVPFIPFLDDLFKDHLTLKVGHFEVNYGDQHFRRTDNAQSLWNPFMEGNIMDAFTTEIGAEVYYRSSSGILAMFGATDGEIQGNIARPKDRSPSLYFKLGYDNQLSDDFRLRVTGSFMTTASSANNTLFGGDRTGSNYQWVIEPTTATVEGNAFSGRFNPGFRDKLTSWVINPFLKFQGLEIFGGYEVAEGRSSSGNEIDDRQATQLFGDILYRFGAREKTYIGIRYNTVDAQLRQSSSSSTTVDVTIDRFAIGAGWFITPVVLLKAEYVSQQYEGFEQLSPTDIRNGAKFDGFVVQGAINF